MPVQLFVDDSGAKGQGRYFLLAGLIAHSDHWAAFSREWQRCLDTSPAVKTFKMREAAKCHGQFYRFSETDRDEKLRSLAKVIDKYAQIATFSSIDLDAHAETWGRKMEKPHNEPYFWPFHNTIAAACFELWDIGWRERFEVIFDDQVIFGPRAKAWYPIVQEVIRYREPEASTIMPIEPMFGSDEQFLPIQACDLIAWCSRRDGNDPTHRPFAWLDQEIRRPYVTDYSQFYDRERMQAVLHEADEHLRNGTIPSELFKKYREHLRRR